MSPDPALTERRTLLAPSTDDDALIVAAGRGDDAAFATFYLRHQTALFGTLIRRTRDRHRSRELTAQTFAAALRRARGFRPGRDRAHEWLLAIAEEKLAAQIAARPPSAPVAGDDELGQIAS